MQESDETEFHVFRVSWKDGGQQNEQSVSARDAYDAAKTVSASVPNHELELIVTAPDGTESVFGFRQRIPTSHLDD